MRVFDWHKMEKSPVLEKLHRARKGESCASNELNYRLKVKVSQFAVLVGDPQREKAEPAGQAHSAFGRRDEM